MTAPIDIEKVFPSYELLTAGNNPDSDTSAAELETSLDPVAPAGTATITAGALTDVSVDTAGSLLTVAPAVTIAAPAGGAAVAQVNSSIDITLTGIPVNGRVLTVGSTNITFGDMASGTGDVKTDIVGTSAVTEAKASVIMDYTGHHSSLNNGITVTIGSVTLTEGVDFVKGADADAFANNLTTAIDNLTDVTASLNKVSASQYLITVEAVTAGSAGNSIASTTSFPSHITIPTATLQGGVDAVDAGDEKDDLAASIASYIRGNVTNFSAENGAGANAGNVITISYTGSNGTNPDSVVGNSQTVSTDATVITGAGTLSGGSVEYRTATATAALYASTDATNRGTIESITVVDAGSGYTSAPNVTIASAVANKNVIEKIAKLGADIATGGSSFNYTKDYIAIALEDFDIDSNAGTLSNALSSSEAAEDTGDFRKLAYHFLRKIHTYLDAQNSVDSVTVTTGGTGYASSDTVTITGGGGTGATATLTVVAGVITAVNITNPGSGYTSTPTATVTTSTGNSAVLAVVLTDNIPDKFSISKGFLTENAATDEVSRDYTTTFTFDESGLEIPPEA